MNVIMQKAQGQLASRKCYHQSKLFVFITSQLSNQTGVRIKSTAIRRPNKRRGLLIRGVRSYKRTSCTGRDFAGYANLQCTQVCRKFFVLIPTKTAWHFKLPSRSKAFGSHHLIVRFTDFLVHKSLFTKGFWLAATEKLYDGATAETANVVRALAIHKSTL